MIAGRREALAQLRHLAAQGLRQLFGQHRQRIPARHHRADEGPEFEAGARPQCPLLDHWQHAGLYQRRFAVAAVALDLQPAAILPASRQRQVFRVALLLVAEAGQRLERLGAAAEEQPGVLAAESVQTEEGAALEWRRRMKPADAGAQIVDDLLRQRFDGRPAGGLEQRQKRRQRLGRGVAQQQRKDRQALAIALRRQMPHQRHLDLCPDPAAHAVAADQHHKGRTTRHRLLQARQPAFATANRGIVLEDLEASLLERGAQHIGRGEIGAAVAEEDLLRGGLRHLCVCIGGLGCLAKRRRCAAPSGQLFGGPVSGGSMGEPRHTRKPMLESRKSGGKKKLRSAARQLHG